MPRFRFYETYDEERTVRRLYEVEAPTSDEAVRMLQENEDGKMGFVREEVLSSKTDGHDLSEIKEVDGEEVVEEVDDCFKRGVDQ